MIIHGFVNPRYLSHHWWENFTFSLERKTEKDIPATVTIDDEARIYAKRTSKKLSYRELELENFELKRKLEQFNEEKNDHR